VPALSPPVVAVPEAPLPFPLPKITLAPSPVLVNVPI